MSACGDTFRPVVNPIFGPGGDPQAQRIALVVTQATPANSGAGAAMHVNLSGDTSVGNQVVGRGPVHGTILRGTIFAFVANRDEDTVTVYSPLTTAVSPVTVSLPAGAAPVFLHSTQTNRMYVAASGLGRVAVINIGISPPAVTEQITVGTTPVSLAQTPDGAKLYAVNNGSNNVSVIRTSDSTVVATVAVGASPVAAVASSDGAAIYVVNQGSGTVSVISPASDTVTATLTAGNSPNFALFDSRLRRLYVTNSGGNSVHIYDATTSPTLPTSVSEVTVGANPVSIAVLADGTRAYVANAGETTGCNGEADAGRVTVIDLLSNTVRKCVTVGRVPVSLAASPESNKVAVANRDSNSVTDIRTSDDTAVATLSTPFNDPNCTTESATCVRLKPLFVTVNQ